MRPTTQHYAAFLAHEPLPGVTLSHNDYVRVCAGEHVGPSGSVVSVEELGPDPIYLVELESGQDVLVAQSCLVS
jgi:hypothetical protein